MNIKKIKILFFLPNLEGGGAERVSINIMRQLDKKYFNISLALVNKSGKYLDLVPSYIDIYDLKTKKTFFSSLKLHKLIKDIKPDIVFSTLIRSHIALHIALINMKNKPLTIMRSPNSPKLLLENKQLNLFYKYLLNMAYKKSDFIIAQTPQMKKEIIKYHNVENSKVHILINPLDTELINKKIQNITNPFNSKKINILSAGRITKQKGFDVLIKSFAKVIKINNNFHLTILGENKNNEKKNLEKLINNLKLDKHISFLGYQDNPYRFFYFCDLYVLSSRWEGLPNTILENLYLNKPIVATKCIPFMEQLIEHGNNGFLVDVDNIEQLANAILNYKKLIINKNNLKNLVSTDINCFFLKFTEKY